MKRQELLNDIQTTQMKEPMVEGINSEKETYTQLQEYLKCKDLMWQQKNHVNYD